MQLGSEPSNCVSFGDNATHAWYPEGTLGNQLPGMDSAVQTAMNDYETFTDLTTTKTNNSPLDVLVIDYLYPDIGLLGWVECLPDWAYSGLHPLLRCDRQKLRFNSREGGKQYLLEHSRGSAGAWLAMRLGTRSVCVIRIQQTVLPQILVWVNRSILRLLSTH